MRSESPAEQPVRDDADLLLQYLSGDPDAFGELFVRHQGHLWAVALRLCGNPEDAADALQDGLIKAMRGAGQFQGRAAVGTWMHRIVANAAIDFLRARHPVVSLDEVPESAGPQSQADQTSWDAGIDLERAFGTLPAATRVALYLVDYEGWTVADTAAALGVAPGTVKSRCSRGRARLAPLLAGYGNQAVPATVQSREHPSKSPEHQIAQPDVTTAPERS